MQKTASGLLVFGMILLVLALLPSTVGMLAAQQFELVFNPLPFRNATLWILIGAVAMIIAGFTVAVVEGFCARGSDGRKRKRAV